MKVVIAIDSFKGSLSSAEAGEAVKSGLKEVFPNAEIVIIPIADGGEGTVDALAMGTNGRFIEVSVSDPIGRPIKAKYGIINDTAVIEMAAASGLPLLSIDERNPLNTTTFGVGEMIIDAVKKGYRDFLIGIGGSATNDCGTGMLSALGFEFLDKNGNCVEKSAKGIKDIVQIKTDNVIGELKECTFNIACDVTNPLCGEKGCSMVFAPQKGGDVDTCVEMDKWIFNFSKLAKKKYPEADETMPGSGAAGGLGFAFTTFLNGKLQPGVDLVLEKCRVENEIKDSDFVITGEGQLDGQTAMGKAPIGVSKIAKKYNIPVIAFAGSVKEDAAKCNENGINAFFPILRKITTLEDAMVKENASANLKKTTIQVFNLLKALK